MSWLPWALLSALFAGLTAILASRRSGDHSNLATAIRTVVILVFVWSIALVTKTQPLSTIPLRTWLFLVFSGLATGLSWLAIFVPATWQASKVAPIDKLSVVVAIVLAALFLGEHLTWRHWVGGT
jgi:transporter family protein